MPKNKGPIEHMCKADILVVPKHAKGVVDEVLYPEVFLWGGGGAKC